MAVNNSPEQHPPVFTTHLIDRINFAIQFEKWRDIIFKRWWIFFLCTSIPLIYSAWRAYNMPDIYEAKGSMMVRPRINLPISDAVSEEYSNFFGTQIQLMQSTQVQEGALKKLRELGYTDTYVQLQQPYQQKNSSIFRLSAISTNPDYAQAFLDEVMKGYVALKNQMREKTTEDTTATILNEVDRLKKELDQIEQEILDFQKTNSMAYIEVQGNSAAQYLADLNRRLAEVRTELQILDAETAEDHPDKASQGLLNRVAKFYSQAESGAETNQEPTVVSITKNAEAVSQLVDLRNTIYLLNKEREDLLAQYQSKHPKITKIDEEIERKQRLYDLAFQRTRDQVKNYRKSLNTQEAALKASIRDWEKQALDSTQKYESYNALKSKQARVRELYNVLLKRLQEIDVSANLNREFVEISEKSKASPNPIGPNRSTDIIKMGLLGLCVALGIILILDRFDDRVKNVDELQTLVHEAVLGQVPMMSGKLGGKGPLFMANLPPHNSFSESFRNVRSSLMFSPTGGKARTIVVTSAIPNDGKTTCAVNLATCLAQVEGGRTLLIDADMRKMNVHAYFGFENGPGLADVLSGKAELNDCIVPTPVANLFLLRAGEPPSNPGELILSENFQALLNEAKSQFQRVVLDTPPVLSTDDALSLAPNIDGVIFVVKANQTSIRFVDRSLSLLKQRGALIFGMVLNQIDTSSAHYYYYYYYTGYYNYSHREKEAKSGVAT